MGSGADAGGLNSIALGPGADASTQNSIALGLNAVASGTRSIVIGEGASTASTNAVLVGGGTQGGDRSVIIGDSAHAITCQNVVVVGYNGGFSVNSVSSGVLLNGSGGPLSANTAGFFVAPVRAVDPVPTGFFAVYYNPATGEFIVNDTS